jgi:hypothetical protein
VRGAFQRPVARGAVEPRGWKAPLTGSLERLPYKRTSQPGEYRFLPQNRGCTTPAIHFIVWVRTTPGTPPAGPIYLRMKQTDVKVPPILLEGDQPSEAPASDQPAKFALGPSPEPASPESAPGPLSEAYGTGRLLLTARDPHCLYAHWDLTSDQQLDFSLKSADSGLQLRLYREDVSGPLVKEVPVQPGSRHSFVDVPASGAKYIAELGYAPPRGPWQRIALSEPALAPSDTMGQQEQIRFATLSFNSHSAPNSDLLDPAGSFPAIEAARGTLGEKPAPVPPTPSPERKFPLPPPLRTGRPWESRSPEPEPATPGAQHQPPAIAQPIVAKAALLSPANPELSNLSSAAPEWTSAQERALAELMGWSFLRQQGLSSADIANALHGEFQRAGISPPGELASIQAAAQLALSSSAALLSPEHRGFWFNVNAELVIYGATQPDAQVTLGGQPIELRPDGTFRCRFALPDGSYQLAIVAVSPQGELRRADLGFSRTSAHLGQVGSLPQDPVLKPPLAETPV